MVCIIIKSYRLIKEKSRPHIFLRRCIFIGNKRTISATESILKVIVVFVHNIKPFCFYLQILNVTKIRRENNEDSVIRQGLNHSIHGKIKKQRSHSFPRGIQRWWKEFISIFKYVIQEPLKQLGQFFKQYLLPRANIINV